MFEDPSLDSHGKIDGWIVTHVLECCHDFFRHWVQGTDVVTVEHCCGFLELLTFVITPLIAVLECLANIGRQFGKQTLDSPFCKCILLTSR